jgi:hypothetical protein
MNKAIRWRIITIQAMLVVILSAASGFLFYEGSFVTTMVRDQLVAQTISFPSSSEIKAGGALDPSKFPAEIQNYAGQQVDNGDKARVYANDFINIHLQGVAGGLTYAQVSAQAQADPTNAKLQGQVATLFKGETLRSILLNAYGWWTIGVYTTYAGIGLMIAALGVLGALAFELVVAGRKPESIKVVQKIAA